MRSFWPRPTTRKTWGPRIINRPSRFDKRFLIGHPNDESRAIYLRYIIGDARIGSIDLDKWVADTDKFSLAHLQELFTAVIVLGDDYDDALKTLRDMIDEHPDSADDVPKKPMGFTGSMGHRNNHRRISDG